MVTTQDKLIAELEALRALLDAAQAAARPVTTRTWREMSWRERMGWLEYHECGEHNRKLIDSHNPRSARTAWQHPRSHQ
jgi:hypothetical protein